MSTGPIDRQAVWDNAAQLISEDAENTEYDRGVAELVAELFGYTRDEIPTLLEALRLRQQQQREVWRLDIAVDPTNGNPR